MPKANKKGLSSSSSAGRQTKAAVLGQQVETLEKRIHSLKVNGKTTHLASIGRHMPVDYSPDMALSPLARIAPRVSETGLQWALEHMDPCGVTYTSPGVPDYSTGTRHIKTLRLGEVISPPPGLGGPDSSDSWDLLIMTTPFVESPMIHFKKKSSDPWPNVSQDGSRNAFYAAFFNSDGSGTVTHSAPNFNDGSTNASIWSFPDAYPGGVSSHSLQKEYDAVRLVSRGLTTELIGPMLFKGGRVFSGQVMPSTRDPFDAPFEGQAYIATDGAPTYASNSLQEAIQSPAHSRRTSWLIPALGPQPLVEGDPLYRERDAEEGDYNVTRVWKATGVCDMVPTTHESAVIINSDRGADPTGAFFVGNVVADVDPTPATWALAWMATPAPGANTTIVYYTGLNPSQSVRFKMKTTIEGVPKLGGPYAALSKIAPEADPLAIQLVADITNTLPHSYPASYNDLGGLLGVIGGVLKSVGVPLLRGVGAAGIPVLSPVVQILTGLANSTFGTTF